MSLGLVIPILLAIAVLGLSKGGLAGVGIVSTPFLALFMGPLEAAAFLLPILIVQDAVAVISTRRTVDVAMLLVLVPGGLVGIAAAFLFASHVPSWMVEVALGAISILFAVRALAMPQGQPEIVNQPGGPKRHFDRAVGAVCGAIAGFTSTVAHAGTPGFQMYAHGKNLDRDTYIGTSSVFFAMINLCKVPAFLGLGELTWPRLLASLAFAPVAVVTSFVGLALVRRLKQTHFRTATNVILLIIGVFVALRGVMES